ncbi:MAG: twin-arginine translocation signal domain-containing protein [Xanthobacteraceae bacterium]
MDRRQFLKCAAAAGGVLAAPALIRKSFAQSEGPFRVRYYPVEPGMGSRDVTSAPDGSIWFCGQRNGTLGTLDPRGGAYKLINLGPGAAPHGVIVGPDGAPWVTEGGQNAIARVDPKDHKVTLFKLPANRGSANLNTGVFDKTGIYWFTGQNGIYGRLDPKSREMTVWDAPRGRGPYGITRTPNGDIWYASLAGNHIAQIDRKTGNARVVEPPTPGQGARRVWSDSKGRLWVSEWNSGNVSVHDPADGSWRQWKLPGERPRAYSVYVDDKDIVWLTDFSANAIVRFDPTTEKFVSFPSDKANANVRQMDGRPGQAWGGEPGNNRLVVIETNPAA